MPHSPVMHGSPGPNVNEEINISPKKEAKGLLSNTMEIVEERRESQVSIDI
jgi:hypothetical protein